MRIHFSWIVFLILPYSSVTSKPIQYHTDGHVKPITQINSGNNQFDDAHDIPKHESSNEGEQIISVRITSSIAVDRGKGKSFDEPPLEKEVRTQPHNDFEIYNPSTVDIGDTTVAADFYTDYPNSTTAAEVEKYTETPPILEGANMEFIKQLQAKKGTKSVPRFNDGNSYHVDNIENDNIPNESEIKPTLDLSNNNNENEDDEDVPLARSVPLSYSSKRYLQDSTQRSQGSFKLTTVNFNVVHDMIKEPVNDHASYAKPNHASDLQGYYSEPEKVYNQPAQIYSEPAKFYSEPAKFYSEPAKIYSEPAKIYGEPSKIYSEPAKIYSRPAKIYSEPAKFYSQPASLHLGPEVQPSPASWKQTTDAKGFNRAIDTTPISLVSSTAQIDQQKQDAEHLSENNYEVDEKVSVMTDGQSHGVQQSSPENCKQENCKVGYVVEGRQFRKYRVEERTPDGFIVGEYGVVRNEDGALRGVRYTADSEASPRLIHDALMKFLQLK